MSGYVDAFKFVLADWVPEATMILIGREDIAAAWGGQPFGTRVVSRKRRWIEQEASLVNDRMRWADDGGLTP